MEYYVADNDCMHDMLKPKAGDTIFFGENNVEMLRLNANGDIYVKGRLVENDKEVVAGLREFLACGR